MIENVYFRSITSNKHIILHQNDWTRRHDTPAVWLHIHTHQQNKTLFRTGSWHGSIPGCVHIHETMSPAPKSSKHYWPYNINNKCARILFQCSRRTNCCEFEPDKPAIPLNVSRLPKQVEPDWGQDKVALAENDSVGQLRRRFWFIFFHGFFALGLDSCSVPQRNEQREISRMPIVLTLYMWKRFQSVTASFHYYRKGKTQHFPKC